MKYIIMCGGNYSDNFKKPKQLLKVNGEVLVERTIRLLKENGVNDIAITTNNSNFDYLDVEIIKLKNEYSHNNPERHKKSKNSWLNAYYPVNEPCCYLHGDCYFSNEAIKTIVETKVKDTMFFCVRDIYDGRPMGVNAKGREPLGFKVENQKIFRQAIDDLFQMIDAGKFETDPISWNLYRQLNGLELDFKGFGNGIFNTNGDYVVIDDYSTDIDNIKDIEKIEKLIKIMKGEVKMVKAEVIEEFTLAKFNELKNLARKEQAEVGRLFVGDTFECTEEMAKYLTGDNPLKRAFVKVIEVIPEKVIEEKPVEEVKPKTRRKKK